MSIQAGYDYWSSTYDTDYNITRDLDAAVTGRVLADFMFDSVIDFGCGTGKNIPFFSSRATTVLGIDFSKGMINKARDSIRLPNVSFLECDIAQSWPVSDASQDLISCNLVLQHVQNLNAVFAEAMRTLKPGALFFINELHPIKKYQGSMARYLLNGEELTIPAFDHQISCYTNTARGHHFILEEIDEAWHETDAGRPPRLVTFLFRKPKI